MTKLERLPGDPPGVYHITSTDWPTAPPRLEGAWIAYGGKLAGIVKRAYHYPEPALLVLMVHTFLPVPSIAELVDELLELARREMRPA